MKSNYRFCARSEVIPRINLITSRCSGNEPALGQEREAEIEPRYVWTGPQWQRKRKGEMIARAKGKNADGGEARKANFGVFGRKKLARNETMLTNSWLQEFFGLKHKCLA